MSEHYDFHYQPTGSGAISGQQVLQQTEDAINELGDYVNDNIGGAMDVAQQALETAQNAEQDAQTALDTANSFSSAIQSAQQDASTALSTAQTAQTTATNANNTAIQAQQDASSAVTTANNASGQVSTLSGTVTALGQRVTTAEGNIGQNTSDITALTTRVGTAEGNITTLQNDVTIAQGNASSAMATAGTVKQQAYVFRYSSTALVASSTNANSLLDNTDNLKIGDKVIDSNGVLFSITAIDTANSTFTIGTALIDLANDADVVHKSGNETISGNKTFNGNTNCVGELSQTAPFKMTADTSFVTGNKNTSIYDQNGFQCANDQILYNNNKNIRRSWTISNNGSGTIVSAGINLILSAFGSKAFYPISDNDIDNGSSSSYWKNTYTKLVNGVEPSSLSLPDLSNGIDISSYITDLNKGVNTYTPPANGWLNIRVKKTSLVHASLMIYQTGGLLSSCETAEFNISGTNLPVIANRNVEIYIYADALVEAKFYPCQGNL